jgi:hypothetical protein
MENRKTYSFLIGKGLSVRSCLKIGCFTFFCDLSFCYLMPNAFNVARLILPIDRLFAF